MTKSGFRKHAQRAVAAVLSGALAFSMCPAAAFATATEGTTSDAGVELLSETKSFSDLNCWAICRNDELDVENASSLTYNDLDMYVAYEDEATEERVYLSDDCWEFGGWYKEGEGGGYEKLDAFPTSAGYFYYAKVVGKGEYTGELYARFSLLDFKDLSNWDAECENTLYEGDFTTPTAENLGIRVYRRVGYEEQGLSSSNYEITGWKHRLDEVGEDGLKRYEDIDNAPTTVGSYQVVLSGKSPYSGTKAVDFEIENKKDISKWYWSAYCENHNFYNDQLDGFKFEDLGVVVYFSDDDDDDEEDFQTLPSDCYEFGGWYKYDEDTEEYTECSSSDLATPGDYYAKVVGKNGYSGERYISFYVEDGLDLTNWDVRCINYDQILGASEKPALGKLGLEVSREVNGKKQLLSSDNYEITGWYKSVMVDDAETWKKLKSAPSAAGTYFNSFAVGIKGKGDYKGANYASFELTCLDGKEIYDNGSYYKVISTKKKTVSFTGSYAKKVSIASTAECYGLNFKVTSVAAKALKGSKATKVTVGDNVTTIGASAFANSKKLKSFTIGKDVKKVGKNALKGCKKLKTITVKSGKLAKSSIKALVKGSKVKTIKLSGKAAKKMKSKYKKWLKGTGVKVK